MEEETNITPEETVQKKPNFLVIGLVLVLVLLVVSTVLGGKKKTNVDNSAKTETAVTQTPAAAGTTAASPVDIVNGAISVEAGSFYFQPNLIRVRKSEKVKLTLNSVSMMHDFNIDELGVKVPVIYSGSSATVEFVASKVGEFEFYCSVGEHRQLGQVGKLIITE